MVDRSQTPDLKQIDSIDFVAPEIRTEFAVPFFVQKQVPNATSRIELYFNAGSTNGKIGLASLVSGLLLSGTEKMNSTEIHTELDNLGGFHDISLGHESVVVSLYGLNDKLKELLSLFSQSLSEVNFSESEIQELKEDRKQKLRINMQKVSFLAQREFSKNLFADSQYGRLINEDNYDSITRQEIIDFHKAFYLSGLFKVVLIGDFQEETIVSMEDMLIPFVNNLPLEYNQNLQNTPGLFHTEKEDALQTAIRVGRILFNRKNDDFVDVTILNTILGDYFGSRLMSNLREDKGFTYGVGSMLSEFNETGYFLIATEVGKEHKDAAIAEIRAEIERIQHELIPAEELDLVRNYLLGQLLKSADGPYAMTDLYVGVQAFGLDISFYDRYIKKIHEITPEKLQLLAKTYLDWSQMTIVSAG
jgi:predicted Zn-dependent peptidase